MAEQALLYLTDLRLVQYPASEVGRDAFNAAIADATLTATPFAKLRRVEEGRKSYWRVMETYYFAKV